MFTFILDKFAIRLEKCVIYLQDKRFSLCQFTNEDIDFEIMFLFVFLIIFEIDKIRRLGS